MADSSGPGLGQPSAPTDLTPVLVDLAAILAAIQGADFGGLVFFGTADAGMAASQTVVTSDSLGGYGDDMFNDKYYMFVIRNANAVGVAPEFERRQIIDYVSGPPGVFTTDPFTANVEGDDTILIVHKILVDTRDLSQGTFDMVNGELELQETNWDVTMDGTELDLWIENSPQGAMEPLVLLVDLDALADGDRIIIREKYREEKGEGEVQLDEETFEGADGGLEGSNKKVEIDLKPNRHGYSITAEQDLGTNRTLPCEIFRRA